MSHTVTAEAGAKGGDVCVPRPKKRAQLFFGAAGTLAPSSAAL